MTDCSAFAFIFFFVSQDTRSELEQKTPSRSVIINQFPAFFVRIYFEMFYDRRLTWTRKDLNKLTQSACQAKKASSFGNIYKIA